MQKKEGLISKAIQIGKAYLSDAPDTDWYKERMSICDSCEFNTKNKKNPTDLDKIQNKIKPACSICHCFIDEKAKVEESTCGLEEIDMPPKWQPVSVPAKGHNIRVSKVDGDDVRLDYTKNGDVYCIINSKKIVERFRIKISKCDLLKVNLPCSCVTVHTDEEEDGYILNVSISTVGFKDYEERFIYVVYYKTPTFTKTLPITLKITKNA